MSKASSCGRGKAGRREWVKQKEGRVCLILGPKSELKSKDLYWGLERWLRG